MSAKICQATTVDNRKCSFKANKKYGDYCGIHKNFIPPPPSPIIETPIIETPVIETPIVIAAHLKSIVRENSVLPKSDFVAVQYTEKEAENYIRSKHYGKIPYHMENFQYLVNRASDLMNKEQCDIFYKNPKAEINVKEEYKEEYQAYRRGILFYYNTLIQIVNMYYENNNKKLLYTAVAWNNFFANDIYESHINNKNIYSL